MKNIMNAKICFCAALLSLAVVVNAQTIYIPNGTSGIGNNTNSGNVLIGNFNNANNLKLTVPGVYNFEQVNLGQFGNGACGLEFINHTSYNPSYGVRLYANTDQVPGLQIQTANSTNSYNDLTYSTRMFISLDGNVGIGNTSPSHPLTVKPTTDIDAISWRRSVDGNEVGRLGVTGGAGTGRYGWIGLWNATGIQSFQIDAGGGNSYLVSGNVGIGTTNPQNKLDVNGTIRAKEVKVETGWADFVFTPTYKLRPLSEVEQFIKTNGHLPEIPKAEDVQQNGINLGEMQTKLLQKVEELTLYSIEQEKKLEEQAKENIELKLEIKKLKDLILEKLVSK
jgi:hypothetical protein